MFSNNKRQKIGNALEGDVKKATSSYGQMKRKFVVNKGGDGTKVCSANGGNERIGGERFEVPGKETCHGKG